MKVGFSPYRDFWVRLIVSIVLAFFFVFLGSNSVTDIVNGKYFYADVLSGFTLSFIVTTYINIITTYLDNQYPWHRFFTTRLLYQFIAGVIIAAVFVLAFMYTYLIVMLGFSKNEVTFFYTEFPISVLFLIAWNALYVGYYFYYDSKKSKAELHSLKEQLFTLQNVKTGSDIIPALPAEPQLEQQEEEIDLKEEGNTQKIKILVAVSGNKNIPIPVESIAYFYKDGNYTTLKTFQAETYLLNHSLDELMKVLDKTIFFRANRQFIINLKACRFFTNEENGKMALHLDPSYDDEVIISQKRAPAFKEWLNK